MQYRLRFTAVIATNPSPGGCSPSGAYDFLGFGFWVRYGASKLRNLGGGGLPYQVFCTLRHAVTFATIHPISVLLLDNMSAFVIVPVYES